MRGVVAMLLLVVLAGCEGPPGPQGPPGVAGPNGSGLVEVRVCTSPNVNTNTSSLVFQYARYKYADGSVMATCEVLDRATSYSSVAMYSAKMEGAVSGACWIVYDVDTSTSGFWDFRYGDGVTTIEYVDNSSASNGRTIKVACPVS